MFAQLLFQIFYEKTIKIQSDLLSGLPASHVEGKESKATGEL